jgi:hypothetical protein
VEIHGLIATKPLHIEGGGESHIEDVLALQGQGLYANITVRNCTFLGSVGSRETEFHSCILETVTLSGGPPRSIEFSGIIRGVEGGVKMGPGSFFFKPQFVAPEVLDYRLGPQTVFPPGVTLKAPIGVRYTPQTLEVIQVALELRRRGLIQF